MLSEEEKLSRLRQQRRQQAIELAMQGRWRGAVEVNRGIIEEFPGDVEAHNRLGRAYMELGNYAQAKEAYSQTLQLDPFNAIAKKNLQRLNYLGGEAPAAPEGEPVTVAPHHFIEEIGKSGVVDLGEQASRETLARMVAGDKVFLRVNGANLIVENNRGEYLGQVPSRYAQRLIRLMAGGNKYAAAVVSSSEDTLNIIIREVYQDPGQAGRLSFPPKGLGEVRPYVSDRVLRIDDYEEEPGYTIVGGGEVEVLPEESDESDRDTDSDEE